MSSCEKCGFVLPADSAFCPSCGAPVVSSTRSIPMRPSEPSFQYRSRPGGITLLAILQGLTSFFTLLGGVALLVLSAFFAAGGWGLIPEEELADALQQIPWATTFTSVQFFALTTAFLTVVGIVLLILAILGFIMTWGLWSGKSWARLITMILAVIGVFTGLFNLPGSLISILIDVVILYYLTRPHIKAYYQ